MLRPGSASCLLLLMAVACSSGDDDDIVMIRDGGVRDGGVRDAGLDAGVAQVDFRSLTATFATQGCMVPCVIANYQLNIILGNVSEVFKITKVTDLEVQIGTFEMKMNAKNCTGAWWQAPSMGMTAIQMVPINLFDVGEDDMARNDNATMMVDCDADADETVMIEYIGEQKPMRSNEVKVTMRGELEDGSPWDIEKTIMATCSNVPCL